VGNRKRLFKPRRGERSILVMCRKRPHGETAYQYMDCRTKAQISFAPPGLVRARRSPTAYAVGSIITPLRGYRNLLKAES